MAEALCAQAETREKDVFQVLGWIVLFVLGVGALLQLVEAKMHETFVASGALDGVVLHSGCAARHTHTELSLGNSSTTLAMHLCIAQPRHPCRPFVYEFG